MFENVLGDSPSNTVQDKVAKMSKISQTKALFKEVKNLIKLSRVPTTAASSERTVSTLRRLKTWLRTTTTHKKDPRTSLSCMFMEMFCMFMQLLQGDHRWQGDQHPGEFYGEGLFYSSSIVYVPLLASKDFCILND